MEDVIYKSTIGTGGFIATMELSPVNEVLGFCVAEHVKMLGEC